jgi:DHA1 family inner membrane transport protein
LVEYPNAQPFMPATATHHVLTPRRELATLLALGAVQFTHMVDFMILIPLGSLLMREFTITPGQFAQLVASYGISAGVAGLFGGFVLDRYDRKRALLWLYSGFALATFACGLAPTHHWLMLARVAAGAFGGLAGSMVQAMVGDIVPPERRGRAMSIVMGAFPVATVLGVPIGLKLAGEFGWHAPFYMLAGCSLVNLFVASFAIPHLATAIVDTHPFQQMRQIVTHPIHQRAYALAFALVMAGGILIPFTVPSMVLNMAIPESRLWLIYAAAGCCTLVSMPIIGRLTDRLDKLKLLAWMSASAVVVMLIFVRLGPISFPTACVMMALFMVTMSSRFTPAMAMITNAVEARYRGGFMSLLAALQQASTALASYLAGWFVATDSAGHLLGLPTIGYIASAFFILTVLLAAKLRAAAPHVAIPGKHPIPTAPATERASELPAA